MTTKEKAISLIQSLSDVVSLDDVIDRLYLLRKIELGIAQADPGDVMEHDAFMNELAPEDAQQDFREPSDEFRNTLSEHRQLRHRRRGCR